MSAKTDSISDISVLQNAQVAMQSSSHWDWRMVVGKPVISGRLHVNPLNGTGVNWLYFAIQV